MVPVYRELSLPVSAFICNSASSTCGKLSWFTTDGEGLARRRFRGGPGAIGGHQHRKNEMLPTGGILLSVTEFRIPSLALNRVLRFSFQKSTISGAVTGSVKKPLMFHEPPATG